YSYVFFHSNSLFFIAMKIAQIVHPFVYSHLCRSHQHNLFTYLSPKTAEMDVLYALIAGITAAIAPIKHAAKINNNSRQLKRNASMKAADSLACSLIINNAAWPSSKPMNPPKHVITNPSTNTRLKSLVFDAPMERITARSYLRCLRALYRLMKTLCPAIAIMT